MNPKTIILATVGVASFAVGAINQYVWPGVEGTPADVASILIFSVLIFLWFRLDAAQHQYPRSSALSIAVVGLAIVALPYYFFRSRGAMRGFVAVGWFLLALVGSGALTVAGQYAIYFALQA